MTLIIIHNVNSKFSLQFLCDNENISITHEKDSLLNRERKSAKFYKNIISHFDFLIELCEWQPRMTV